MAKLLPPIAALCLANLAMPKRLREGYELRESKAAPNEILFVGAIANSGKKVQKKIK